METIINVVGAIRDLRETHQEIGIILVTHLLKFASNFADQIAFMHDGAFLEELSAKAFVENCQTKEARDFVSAHLAAL